jgi:mannose-1-phosphate guanylyltransferase
MKAQIDHPKEISMPPIIPVILSGGGGTRLWPMSRPECPKQFLALTAEQTMFQLTAARTNDRALFAAPLIVANGRHADMIAQQLSDIGITDARLLLEPCARNTAPAIALAALAAADPAAPLLVTPSDQVIEDVPAFHAAIRAALPLVEQGWLATFGINPTGPETGYGYIQMGEQQGAGVHKVARFVEKPDAARAAEMIAGGDHVWNGGIFLFRADSFLAALAEYAPDMLASAKAAMAAARTDGAQIHPDEAAFAASPADSIDYAVMEKAAAATGGKVCVAPVSMGWSDVGSWDALYEIGQNKGADNAGGEPTPSGALVMELDGTGNLIRSDGIRIHSVGVENMIIVASGNDILILPRGKSQDVKKVVEALKNRD